MSITKLGLPLAIALAAALLGTPADAQRRAKPRPQRITLTSLTAKGFEIKGVTSQPPNFQVVFVQKGKAVYACITGQLSANAPWKSDCYPVE